MIIEMHIDDKLVRIWNVPYSLGPWPMNKDLMRLKELQLDNKVLECRVDAAPMIYNSNYQMFAVLKSQMRTDMVSNEEYAAFLITVAKNKNKV